MFVFIEVPMKKLSFIVPAVVCFISLMGSHVRAEADGSMLLNNCTEAVKYLENKNDPAVSITAVNYCVGYITGINDLHTSFISSVSCFDPPKYCIPQQTMTEQLVKVIVTFLKTHPADLHFQGSDLILAALKEAFPCP